MSEEKKTSSTTARIIMEVSEDTNLCNDMIKVSAVLRAVLHELHVQSHQEGVSDEAQVLIKHAGAIVMQVVTNICMNLEPNQQYDFLEFCGFSEDLVEKILPEIRVTEKILRE